MTVKVNEALCEMKEKLKKTERRVREVMKEKEQLEKILEAKLKMIKVISEVCAREGGGHSYLLQHNSTYTCMYLHP